MKTTISAILACLSLPALPQESIEEHMLKIDIITPGLTYEKGIAENAGFNMDAYLGFLFQTANENSSNYSDRESYFIVYPGLALTLQYYFNRGKRQSRGRPLYNNSGMYLGPEIIIQGPDIANTNRDYVDLLAGLAVGGVWGIQRTFGSNVNVAFNLGLGYGTAIDEPELSGFTPLSKLLISYVIVPRKNKPKQPEIPEDYKY